MSRSLEEDGAKIKPAGYKQPYTAEQAVELLKCTEDPIYFIENYCWITHPTKGRVKFILFEYQKRLIRTYQENRNVISILSRQSGKALMIATRINTPDGWRTMGDLQPGDFVYGSDGKPTRIKWVSEIQYGRPCYEITFDNGEFITADENHLWKVEINSVERVVNTKVLFQAKKEQKKIKINVHNNLTICKGDTIRITDIKPTESVPVKCISVESEDELFLCGDTMIPTHNSTSAAAYLLWWAAFKDDQTVLIASNKGDNAKEIMVRLKFMYEEMPWFLKPGVKENNVFSITFDNNSKIEAQTTTATTGRGKSISLIYCDEFAYVPPGIAQEFWTSLFPVLSCVTGDTLVLTDKGYKRIDEFHEGKEIGDYFELEGVSTWGKHGLEPVSHGYVSPESDTLIIRTKHGLELEVTHNHPLYKAEPVSGIMTPAKHLVVGDALRLDLNMQVFGDDDSLTEDQAYMLGGYIAEGWTNGYSGKKYSTWIANCDDDFRSIFIRNGFREVNNTTHKLVLSSVDYIRHMEGCGIDLSAKCYNKTTPKKIFGVTKQLMSAYLRGLFDGDGSVTNRSINLTSTSKRLIQETQLLLMNYGILSTVRYTSGANKQKLITCRNHVVENVRDSWSLDIPLSLFESFKNQIGFNIKRKADKLDAVINKRKQDDNKIRYIPKRCVVETIRDIITNCGENHHWFRKNGVRIDKVLDDNMERQITVDWIIKLRNLLSDKELSNEYETFFSEYANSDVVWDEIVSITTSTNKTYDFTVPGTHMFLQNGIMGSNTGGKCIITSTPNNDEDKFAKIWFNSTLSSYSDKWEDKNLTERTKEVDDNDYDTLFEDDVAKNAYLLDVAMMDNVEVDETNQGFVGFYAGWTSVPQADGSFRDEKFKRSILASGLTEAEWAREFECSFISADATLISAPALMAIGNTIQKPKFIDKWGCRWYEEILPNAAYAVALDPSAGVELDDACIQVWRVPAMVQVAEWNSNKCGQVEQTQMLSRVLRRIHLTQQANPEHNGENHIYYSVERNGLGLGILTAIEMTPHEDAFPGWLVDSTMRSINIKSSSSFGPDKLNKYRGLVTSTGSKSRYCLEFKSLIERGIFKVRSKHLYSQLKTFVRNGNNWAAKHGKKDDIIMSCIIMCHLIDEVRTYEPDLDDMILPDIDQISPTEEMSLLPVV